ncbi:MAG: ABC transporter permease [Vicinamibacterales bacterium]
MLELLLQTWDNLRANRLRSLLTMFGIAWGVMTIVILSAMGEGFQRGNQAVIRELGKSIIIIRNGRTSLQAGGERAGRNIRLTFDDVLALQAKSRRLAHVSPEILRSGVSVKSEYNASSLQMSGVWPVYQDIRSIEVDRGRPLTQADGDDRRRVLIIGFESAKLLFADRNPIGQALYLNGLRYTVVGRVRKKFQDSNYTGQDDERLFLPYETMRQDFPMTGPFDTPNSVSTIIGAAQPSVVVESRALFEREGGFNVFEGRGGPLEREIREILGPRKGFEVDDPEALSMWNTTLESILFDKLIGAMDEFFLAVGLITLGLGGIGVMNIMLIAVRERTREIGVRKALGATPRLIQWQFFSEGFVLTLLSGAIGFALGQGLCAGINRLPLPERFTGMITTWQTAVMAVATLTIIGVCAATYPARRAAALPPVEALRYEM